MGVLLSTAPWSTGTHWYQIRFLLETPLAVSAGQHIEGHIHMQANNLQSYYVRLVMRIKGTAMSSEAPCVDLKDPEYRFYTSPNTYCPPGTQGVWGQQNATTQPVFPPMTSHTQQQQQQYQSDQVCQQPQMQQAQQQHLLQQQLQQQQQQWQGQQWQEQPGWQGQWPAQQWQQSFVGGQAQ